MNNKEIEYLKDENGNFIKCSKRNCKNKALYMVWNDYDGELPACKEHKISLTQIITLVQDKYHNITKYVRTSAQKEY